MQSKITATTKRLKLKNSTSANEDEEQERLPVVAADGSGNQYNHLRKLVAFLKAK